MPKIEDDYATLGLKPGCPPIDIREAYLSKAKIAHPDAPTGSAVAFQRLHGAYRRAMDDALATPCDVCRGRRKITLDRGIHQLFVPCQACKETGRKFAPVRLDNPPADR